MPTVRVGDADIFFQVTGNGDPLLLVAGFGCDHLIWARIAQTLAQQYRVVVFDHRGIGRSMGPVEGLSLRTLAEDAAGLLRAIGIGAAHVAGHSMGGMVAQEIAIAEPTMVSSLMLFSSCASLDARGRAIIESWGHLPQRVDPEAAARLVLPWLYTNAFFATPGAVDDLVSLMLANPYPPSAQAILAQSRAIQAADMTERLAQIAAPTLVLVGREDILTPVDYSEQLVSAIRSAELEVLDGTGHGLLVESPDLVASAMRVFLEKFG